jgi:hypothetical protein
MLPPPTRVLDLAFRRLSTQTVARENARSAWRDLARGRHERREVQDYLEAHAHRARGQEIPVQRQG